MNANRDVKTTGRPAVSQYAGQARARGADNLERLLTWTYQWGWTTESVAQALLGVRRRVAAEYARKGYLLRIEPPRGHVAAYVVAPAHQSRAGDAYEAISGRAIPYPYPRTAVPFAALAEHQERAQLVAIAELRDEDILTVDREMRAGTGGALPDFAIERGGIGGAIEWHEVELTAKYRERLLFQLEERDQARRAGDYSRLVWHCRTHGIARNLQAELAKPVLPPVVKRADGKIVRMPGVEGWRPDRLRSISTVRVIGAADVLPGTQMELEECAMEECAIDVADL